MKLLFADAELEAPPPTGPDECTGADAARMNEARAETEPDGFIAAGREDAFFGEDEEDESLVPATIIPRMMTCVDLLNTSATSAESASLFLLRNPAAS